MIPSIEKLTVVVVGVFFPAESCPGVEDVLLGRLALGLRGVDPGTVGGLGGACGLGRLGLQEAPGGVALHDGRHGEQVDWRW